MCYKYLTRIKVERTKNLDSKTVGLKPYETLNIIVIKTLGLVNFSLLLRIDKPNDNDLLRTTYVFLYFFQVLLHIFVLGTILNLH